MLPLSHRRRVRPDVPLHLRREIRAAMSREPGGRRRVGGGERRVGDGGGEGAEGLRRSGGRGGLHAGGGDHVRLQAREHRVPHRHRGHG